MCNWIIACTLCSHKMEKKLVSEWDVVTELLGHKTPGNQGCNLRKHLIYIIDVIGKAVCWHCKIQLTICFTWVTKNTGNTVRSCSDKKCACLPTSAWSRSKVHSPALCSQRIGLHRWSSHPLTSVQYTCLQVYFTTSHLLLFESELHWCHCQLNRDTQYITSGQKDLRLRKPQRRSWCSNSTELLKLSFMLWLSKRCKLQVT